MDTKLTKESIRTPGQFAYDLFMKKYKGKPLRQIYDADLRSRVSNIRSSGGTVSDKLKEDITADAMGVRTQQGEAARLLTNILMTTGAIGGGIGVARHLPKWLEAKRELRNARRSEDEPKVASVKDWFTGKVDALKRGCT